jgi:hypothetical protein
MEASYFRQEKVLEYPGRRDLMNNIELVPEEFAVEENLNYDKELSVNEGVSEDDETIKRSTYLLHLQRRTHPRPSAAVLLPLTLCLHRRRVKTLSLPPPTIKLI